MLLLLSKPISSMQVFTSFSYTLQKYLIPVSPGEYLGCDPYVLIPFLTIPVSQCYYQHQTLCQSYKMNTSIILQLFPNAIIVFLSNEHTVHEESVNPEQQGLPISTGRLYVSIRIVLLIQYISHMNYKSYLLKYQMGLW